MVLITPEFLKVRVDYLLHKAEKIGDMYNRNGIRASTHVDLVRRIRDLDSQIRPNSSRNDLLRAYVTFQKLFIEQQKELASNIPKINHADDLVDAILITSPST